MARPPRQDPELTRQQILAIARRDILRDGLEGLSLRSIAREMGYSAGSMYQHFANRDALVRTLVAQSQATMRAAISIAPMDDPDETPLVAMGLAYVRTCRENPEDFVLSGLLRTDDTRMSLNDEVPPGSPYEVIVETLLTAAEDGDIEIPSELELEYMAYGLWALVHGMATLQTAQLKNFDADFEAADRLVLRSLVRGFAPSHT